MKHVKFEDLSPENQLMADELFNPKVRIPKKYLPYLFKAICHYDMEVDDFDNYTDVDNDAFHYFYSLCKENGCN